MARKRTYKDNFGVYKMKNALVTGAGGFIGNALVSRLKSEGYWVRGVDLKKPEFNETDADDFIIGDLRDPKICYKSLSNKKFDECYALAALMGGMGFIASSQGNDSAIVNSSCLINLNTAEACKDLNVGKIFFSSSACVYPEFLQDKADIVALKESDAIPAQPQDAYGWEKLFSEVVYDSYHRDFGIDIAIGRFHNIFGPKGTWRGGKEKAPAAICRKVAEAEDGGSIDVWGDGTATRSFLYIDECLEGIRRLMNSDISEPINIGSDECVTINQLTEMVIDLSGKKLSIKHIDGPVGVAGRNSDNGLIKEKLEWEPNYPLKKGMSLTYDWIKNQVEDFSK